jgi:UDP-N-acetylmuramoyl-tripeptide--D-alanyl-D-alanine ligase
MKVSVLGRIVQARLPGGGEHRALTLAATLLATQLLGMDLSPALDLPDTMVPAGRGNLLQCAGIDLIDESYNANPESMRATLQSFATRSCSGKKYVLLGEMLELGDSGALAHEEILKAASVFDGCFLVGEGFSTKVGATRNWFPEAGDELLTTLATILKPDDSLLIKGSNRVFWAKGFVQQLAATLQAT